MIISDSTLSEIRKLGISIPEYSRKDLSPSIAHIGLGHFHRSHFLTYIDELLRNGFYHNGVFEIDIIPVFDDFINKLRRQTKEILTILSKLAHFESLLNQEK